MARSYGVASVSRCPWRVRLYPNSDQNVAVPRLSAMCRYCCKSLFALLIKISLGSRCDLGINMRGTSSHSDELTGDFGNKPEAILIGDHGLSCLLAGKLSLRDLRLLQQYLPVATNAPQQTTSLFDHLVGALVMPASPRLSFKVLCR